MRATLLVIAIALVALIGATEKASAITTKCTTGSTIPRGVVRLTLNRHAGLKLETDHGALFHMPGDRLFYDWMGGKWREWLKPCQERAVNRLRHNDIWWVRLGWDGDLALLLGFAFNLRGDVTGVQVAFWAPHSGPLIIRPDLGRGESNLRIRNKLVSIEYTYIDDASGVPRRKAVKVSRPQYNLWCFDRQGDWLWSYSTSTTSRPKSCGKHFKNQKFFSLKPLIAG